MARVILALWKTARIKGVEQLNEAKKTLNEKLLSAGSMNLELSTAWDLTAIF
jgi:hypothetical protein